MLSLEECRKYLPKEEFDISDEHLTELRSQLYGMAELALEDYFERKAKTSSERLGEEINQESH